MTNLWSHRALRQLCLGNVCHALEVVMTGVAEVGGAETEEDSHGAAVATLILQVVCTVLGTHLGLGEIKVKSELKIWVKLCMTVSRLNRGQYVAPENTVHRHCIVVQ